MPLHLGQLDPFNGDLRTVGFPEESLRYGPRMATYYG